MAVVIEELGQVDSFEYRIDVDVAAGGGDTERVTDSDLAELGERFGTGLLPCGFDRSFLLTHRLLSEPVEFLLGLGVRLGLVLMLA